MANNGPGTVPNLPVHFQNLEVQGLPPQQGQLQLLELLQGSREVPPSRETVNKELGFRGLGFRDLFRIESVISSVWKSRSPKHAYPVNLGPTLSPTACLHWGGRGPWCPSASSSATGIIRLNHTHP